MSTLLSLVMNWAALFTRKPPAGQAPTVSVKTPEDGARIGMAWS